MSLEHTVSIRSIPARCLARLSPWTGTSLVGSRETQDNLPPREWQMTRPQVRGRGIGCCPTRSAGLLRVRCCDIGRGNYMPFSTCEYQNFWSSVSDAAKDVANKKHIVRFKNTFIGVSGLSTEGQRRELLPQCQAGQAAQDAQWRQGCARPGRENHPGRGISEGRG